MLVILSIMGAFAMTISMIEQRVTLNSEVFQHNFYSVEGATLEAAAVIDQTDDSYPAQQWCISSLVKSTKSCN